MREDRRKPDAGAEKQAEGEESAVCRYDAFISYRHTQPDAYAAQTLHRMLESFRLPSRMIRQKQFQKTRLRRVFRDQEELPLTSNLEAPILEALRQSEYLIVICSPRLQESQWCKKEIQTFLTLHGREKVLAVLAEGEPEDAFPEELLWKETEVTGQDGQKRILREKTEPLAADIRGKNRRAVKKALRTEILRLLAPMFGCGYDDLRQRHRERRMKRILTAALAGSAVCLAFGAVSTAMALRIRSQREQISRQNRELLEDQALNLAQRAMDLLSEGDRMGALETACRALTGYGEITSLPETAQARYALAESLGAYDNGAYTKPAFQLKAKGKLDFMSLSPRKEKVLAGDSLGFVTVWDLRTGRKLLEADTGWGGTLSGEQALFLTEETVAYLDRDWNIKTAVIPALPETAGALAAEKAGSAADPGEAGGVPDPGEAGSAADPGEAGSAADPGEAGGSPAQFLYTDRQGSYLAAVADSHLDLYRTEAVTEAADGTAQPYRSMDTQDGLSFTDAFLDTESCILLVKDAPAQEGGESLYDRKELLFWDPQTDAVTAGFPLEPCLVMDAVFCGGRAFVLLNTERPAAEEGLTERYTAKVMAFDTGTGGLLWEDSLEDTFASQLCPSQAPGSSGLLVLSGDETYLLDRTDGSVRRTGHYGSSVQGVMSAAEKEVYALMSRDGGCYYVNPALGYDLEMTYQIQCPCDNIKEAAFSACGLLVLPHQEDRITVLKRIAGKGLAETAEEIPQAPCGKEPALTGYEASEAAKGLGLPRAAMVSGIVYDEQGTHRFVSYQDGTLEIYETADSRPVHTVEGLKEEMISCLGRDAEGNIYLAGYSFGYVLDREYRPVACMEGLAGLDPEGGRVFLKKGEQVYTVPVYSTKQLLSQAERELNGDF